MFAHYLLLSGQTAKEHYLQTTAFVKLNLAMYTEILHTPEIHPSAVIAPTAKIGKDCYIGPNAVVGDGAEIGDGCVVAANAVVTKKFSDNSVIGGVPAKVIRER